MSHLKLVKNNVLQVSQFQLLVVGERITRVLTEEQAVEVPLISLVLARFYTLDGCVDAGAELGWQAAAKLTVSYRGERRTIKGAVAPLLSGPDLVLPFGYLVNNAG